MDDRFPALVMWRAGYTEFLNKMKRGLGRDLLRVFLTSLSLGIAMGSLMYVLMLVAPARHRGTTADEFGLLVRCFTIPGGLIFALCAGAGLLSLPPTRRLKRAFGIVDRWPRHAAEVRQLEPLVPTGHLRRELAAAIHTHLPVLGGEKTKQVWNIRVGGLFDYSVALEGGAAGEALTLVVCNRWVPAWIQPNDLTAARILAGLLIELARKGVIRDCAHIPPRSLRRDLGPLWRPGAAPPGTVPRRVRFTLGAIVRMVAAVMTGIGISIWMAPLEESGQISKLVRMLPALLAVVYVNAEIAFAMQSARGRGKAESSRQ